MNPLISLLTVLPMLATTIIAIAIAIPVPNSGAKSHEIISKRDGDFSLPALPTPEQVQSFENSIIEYLKNSYIGADPDPGGIPIAYRKRYERPSPPGRGETNIKPIVGTAPSSELPFNPRRVDVRQSESDAAARMRLKRAVNPSPSWFRGLPQLLSGLSPRVRRRGQDMDWSLAANMAAHSQDWNLPDLISQIASSFSGGDDLPAVKPITAPTPTQDGD